MSQQSKTYDADRVSVSFAGIVIDGFGEDTFVTIERTTPRFSTKAGANGEVVRSKSNDFRAKVKIKLMQTSLSNALLSQRAELDRLSNTGAGVLMIRDQNGTSLHIADQAWIAEMPGTEYAREATDREWIFECAELRETIGSE